MKLSITEEQFNKAYNNYYKEIVRYINFYLKNGADIATAEDLTQQTFIRFLKSGFTDFEDEIYLERYLKSIAKNCFRTYVRYMQVAGRTCLSLDDSDTYDGSIDTFAERYDNEKISNIEKIVGIDLSEYNNYDAQIAKVKSIINRMPPKQKAAMIEIHFNGLKPAAAAKKLNTTANCICFLTSKGRNIIKEKLTYCG